MARVEIWETVIDHTGRPLNGATVQVYERGTTTPVTVYDAATAGSVLPLPLTTVNGRITGYVEEGSYDLVVTYAGTTAPAHEFEARSGASSGGGSLGERLEFAGSDMSMGDFADGTSEWSLQGAFPYLVFQPDESATPSGSGLELRSAEGYSDPLVGFFLSDEQDGVILYSLAGDFLHLTPSAGGAAKAGLLAGPLLDVNLYRDSANVWKTDDGLEVAGALTGPTITALQAADAALDGRVDALEAIPTTKTFRTTHTFAIKDAVTVDTIPGFWVSEAAGQSIVLAAVRYKIGNAGATVDFKIQRNGADIAGFGTSGAPLTAVNTAFTTNPADVALSDLDELTLVIVAATTSPVDLQVTLILEHTI